MPVDWGDEANEVNEVATLPTRQELARIEDAAWHAQCVADIWSGIAEFYHHAAFIAAHRNYKK